MELMKIDRQIKLGPTTLSAAETLACGAEQVFYLEIQPCWTDPRQVCWLLLGGWQSPGNEQINDWTEAHTHINNVGSPLSTFYSLKTK